MIFEVLCIEQKMLIFDHMIDTHNEPGRAALVSKLRGSSMKLVENAESTAVYPQRASRFEFKARCWLTLLYVWLRV